MFSYSLPISVCIFLSLFFPNWLLCLGFLYYLFVILLYFFFICKTNLISLYVRYFKIGFSYTLKVTIFIYVFVKFINLARICLSVWTNSYRQTRTNPAHGRILSGVFYDSLNYLFLFGIKYFIGLYFGNYIMQM